MDNSTKDNGQIRKSTYADRLQKEISDRKTATGIAALLAKLNPFAVVTANK